MSPGSGSATPEDGSSPREERIAAILSEWSDRLNAGEALDARAILQRSPDLLPELEWALRALSESSGMPPSEAPIESVGHHRIVREIGRGGMGIVYDAVELTLGRRVALKVLPLPTYAQGSRRERFLREARAAARLHHTSIVPVYEVGEEAGVLYYTMQHIAGRSLDQVLRTRAVRQWIGSGAGEPRTEDSVAEAIASRLIPCGGESASAPRAYHQSVARIGAQVAGALAHAHREGVLHRDVKPSNILLDEEGFPWLTDFGLAKSEIESGSLTRSGDVLGTVAYLAPERLSGEGDARGDVYSLGATLHELLTLRPPFQDPDRGRLLQAVSSGALVRPRQLDPRIPADLETIVLKAMSRDPVRRYASAEELEQDLERFLHGEPIAARRVGSLERLGRWCSRHPLIASLCGTVAALIIVLISVLMVSAQRLGHRLYEAELERARALVASGKPGRRFESLAAISRAAQIGSDDGARGALRDVAIEALSLVDIREAGRRDEPLLRRGNIVFDSDLTQYAVLDPLRGEITFRSLIDGRELRRLPGAANVQRVCALSSDGRFLVAQCLDGPDRHTVRVWNVPASSIWMDLDCGSSAGALDFDPRSNDVAISKADGSFARIDLESRAERRTWHTGSRPVQLRLATHRNAAALGLRDRAEVEVWNLDQDVKETSISGNARFTDIAWCPGSDLLATSSYDEHIRLWDSRTGDLVRSLEGHAGSVLQIAFSPCGETLVSSSWDGTLRFWDPWGGGLLLTLPMQSVRCHFSRDGERMATVGLDVTLWDLALARERRVHRSPSSPSVVGGTMLELDRSGRFLACGWSLWDVVRCREVETGSRWDFSESFRFHPDGKSLLIHSGRGVSMETFELVKGREADILRLGGNGERLDLPHGAGPFAFDSTGRLLAVNVSGKLLVLLGPALQRKKKSLGDHAGCDFVSVSPDGKWVASGTHIRGFGGKIWDVAEGRCVQDLEPEQPAHAWFSPGGRWIAVSTPNQFRILETGTWKPYRTFPRKAFSGVIGPVAWHPDGKRIALTTTPIDVQLVDVESGESRGWLGTGQLHMIQALDFSPDGELLALGRSNATTEVWDLRRIGDGLAALGLELPGQPSDGSRDRDDARGLRVEWVDSSPAEGGLGPAEGGEDPVPAEVLRDPARILAVASKLQAEGKWIDAIGVWEQGHRALPDSPFIANNLAWALLTCPESMRDPVRALALAEAAVRGEENPVFLNTLGVARYRTGSYREAVDLILEAARKVGEVTAWDAYFVAMALKRSGSDILAGDYYRNAIQWQSRHPDLPKDQWRELRAIAAEAKTLLGGQERDPVEGAGQVYGR